MNIKTFRKSYICLTLLERLALADQAEARDDESEIQAINSASPMESRKVVDYYDLLEEINKIRLLNLICCLSYMMRFDYFSNEIELEFLRDRPNAERELKLENCMKMAAFLYVRAKDSWNAVCEEFGFRKDFDEKLLGMLFSVEIFRAQEDLIRAEAFTEEEIQEYMKKKTGPSEIQTFDEEVTGIKKALGLPITKK